MTAVDPPATRGEALSMVLAAYGSLADLAETVADEWTYVTALAAAGRARLTGAAGDDLEATLAPAVGGAIEVAAAEVRLIVDPHRAIDWLSTMPAVVELALAGHAG